MIRFNTSQEKRLKILSVNNDRFAEIVDVSETHMTLRLVFSIDLSVTGRNPFEYNKVQLFIRSNAEQGSEISFSNNESIRNIARPTNLSVTSDTNLSISQNLSRELNGSLVHSPKNKISNLTNAKRQTDFSVISNYRKQLLTQRNITSCVVTVSDIINDFLKNPCEFTDLYVPEIVNISQGKRQLEQRINKDYVLREVNSQFESPTQYFDPKDSSIESSFGKKIVDYLLNDANLPEKSFIDNNVFYSHFKNVKFLNVIEIPCEIKVPIRYRSIDLTAEFELYKFNSSLPDETTSQIIKTNSLLEAYNLLDQLVKLDYSPSNDRTSSKRRYSVSFSYDGIDKKKIDSFNVYTKSLMRATLPGRYSLVTNINKNQVVSSNYQDFFSLLGIEESSLRIVRLVPVTTSGESSTFSDIVLGEGIKEDPIDRLVLIADQIERNRIKIDIENIAPQAENIDIYRRNCTLSNDARFVLAKSIKNIQSINTGWLDVHCSPNSFYEYYAVTTNVDGKILQTSNYFLIQFLNSSMFASKTSVTNIVTDGINASFDITTLQDKKSSNLYMDAVNSAYSSELTQQSTAIVERLDPLQNKTFKSPVASDFKNLYFHRITRINKSTGESESFRLVPDGTFEDKPDTRRISGVSEPSLGGTYVYQVITYMRDPLSSKQDFIATSDDSSGKVWFHRPYKWHNPTVLQTGILYADNEEGIPQLQDEENFTSGIIGMSAAVTVVFKENTNIFSINPIAEFISRSVIKISWQIDSNIKFDSFAIVKVVNGKRFIAGKTHSTYFYHKLSDEDVGTIYYEITMISEDFSIKNTYNSNSILVKPDFTKVILRKIL